MTYFHPYDEELGNMSTQEIAEHLQFALLAYNDTGFSGIQWEPPAGSFVTYIPSGWPIYLAEVPDIFRDAYSLAPQRQTSMLTDADILDAFAYLMRHRLVVFDPENMCAFAATHDKEDMGHK